MHAEASIQHVHVNQTRSVESRNALCGKALIRYVRLGLLPLLGGPSSKRSTVTHTSAVMRPPDTAMHARKPKGCMQRGASTAASCLAGLWCSMWYRALGST